MRWVWKRKEEVDRLVEAGWTSRERVAVSAQPDATAVTDGDMLRQVVQPLTDEDRRRLFNRFYRGKAARATEGLGLGLALSWEICELLGARIELVGEGPATCFRVFVPRSARGRMLP